MDVQTSLPLLDGVLSIWSPLCGYDKLVPFDMNLGIECSFWDSFDDTTVHTGLSGFAVSRSSGALPAWTNGKSTNLRIRRYAIIRVYLPWAPAKPG